MTTITLTEAQATLAELIHRLTPPTDEPRKVPQLGTLRGTVLSMDHFDDPMEDFAEYRR